MNVFCSIKLKTTNLTSGGLVSFEFDNIMKNVEIYDIGAFCQGMKNLYKVTLEVFCG
jgi:hypothetical protein